jgi:hypothetical protein
MNNWLPLGLLLIAAPALAQNVDVADVATVRPTATEAALELVSFTAESAGNDGVRLHWATVSERPNEFFVVQRSSNGLSWETAVGTPGTGRDGHTTYTIVDPHPFEEVSYYRLMSLEDGTATELSDVFAVDHHPQEALLIQNGKEPGRFVVTADGTLTDVKLLNDRGQFIQLPLDVQPDLVRVNAELLAPGTYYVQAVVNGNPVLRPVTFTGTSIIGG